MPHSEEHGRKGHRLPGRHAPEQMPEDEAAEEQFFVDERDVGGGQQRHAPDGAEGLD